MAPQNRRGGGKPRGGRPGQRQDRAEQRRGGARQGGRPGKEGRPSGGGRSDEGKSGKAVARVSLRPGEVQVNAYSETWLKKGFCWVYPNEVAAGDLGEPGSWIRLKGPQGGELGEGISDDGWIAIRRFPRDRQAGDVGWLVPLLQAALQRRAGLVPPQTTAFRWVHGENDDLPGIRVDWWDGWCTVVLDSPSLAVLLDPLWAAMQQVRPDVKGAYLCYRSDPRESRELPAHAQPGWISEGKVSEEYAIVERGMKMLVRPWEGPDTGSYMDMREVRRFLEPSWQGTRVLNTFAYTCAFSVAAAIGGAEHVHSVDLSRYYLARGEDNFRANGLDPDAHVFEEEDTFKALDRMRRKGELFDRIILDPPSFSHSKEGRWSSKKDMPRLVAAAARVCAPGGWIIAASNQGQMAPKVFRGHVADGIRKAGRTAVEAAFFGAAPDFPAATHFPEGRYLKVGVWVVS